MKTRLYLPFCKFYLHKAFQHGQQGNFYVKMITLNPHLFLSLILVNNNVKSNFLLNQTFSLKLVSRNIFHVSQCDNFGNSLSHILAKISWKQRFFLLKKYVLTKEMIWRNIFSVRVNFWFYHTVCYHTVEITKFDLYSKTILKNFTVNWFDGKKFAWQWIFQFSTLWRPNFEKFIPNL